MLSGGVSIQGTYHELNQDNYYSGEFKNGHVLIVSDGLGSKRDSQVGSKMVCESVLSVLDRVDINVLMQSKDLLLTALHEKWLSCLKNYNIYDCYATVLFCIITADKVIAARLGDGFLALLMNEESIVLFDRKEEYFANETDCLTEKLDLKNWEFLEIKNSNFIGAIACTDGVGIDPIGENVYKSFSREFIIEYVGKEPSEISKSIIEWLSVWPGSDDKTIAFLLEGMV